MSDYTSKNIKYLLKERGASFSKLAKELGFSYTEIHGALYRPIFCGEQIIAGFLNIYPITLWPDRYGIDGKPLHPYASTK